MSETDVRSLYEEVQAATGLLMLHTYDDLGVDLSCLAGQYSALSDFRSFLVLPTQANLSNQSPRPLLAWLLFLIKSVIKE